MKPIRIVPAGDDRTFVPFVLPYTVEGEPAFDGDKPVDGRAPVQFTVPRFDFIPDDEFEELTEELKTLDGKDLPPRKLNREVALMTLRRYVNDETYAALARLTTGELDQVMDRWRTNSSVTLGE